MKETATPKIVARDEWEKSRAELLAREKAHTHAGDELAAARRRLPMTRMELVKVVGRSEPVPLVDVFEGRRMLIVYHFMWKNGAPHSKQCEGCTHSQVVAPRRSPACAVDADGRGSQIEANYRNSTWPASPMISCLWETDRNEMSVPPHQDPLLLPYEILKMFLRTCVCVLLVNLPALPFGQETGDKEIKKLQGNWKVVSSQVDNVKIPAEAFKKVVVTFEDDKISFKENRKTYEEIKFHLEPAATPQEINYLYLDGLKKGVKEKGIYKLEGDQLTLCIAQSGQKRPEDFASKKGTGQQLMVLKRLKS
jgi:uncharacterized protein (TIGR03067 family)